MKRLTGIIIALSALIFLSPGCYSLSGSAVPPAMRTVHIDFFENDAPIVVSYLSLQFTEALKERIRTTTKLSIVTGEGDANMGGSITGYSYAPASIQATNPNQPPIAGASILTITVRAKFTYDADKKLNFDQAFTKTVNFTGDINSQEQNLIRGVVKQLVDEIFNKAFNNW
ncbi:LPS assembly lipoprotein LptE [Mucilaginibacter antarcticus]|uniref:LPS assembly lipoprotein LptE n=1 Tax=Mucilaginibacter antarcticus TaxID=1855725 RepID=A0ABW5XJX9_9SPHI